MMGVCSGIGRRSSERGLSRSALCIIVVSLSALAGVLTDYIEIGLLWSNIGRRTAISLPIITVPQIVLFGYALNIFVVA